MVGGSARNIIKIQLIKSECILIMDIVEERRHKQCENQQLCWERNFEALLELQCVANVNKTYLELV
jgi:hypothetical protein